MSDSDQVWVYAGDGVRHGPTTAREIANLLLAERLTADTLVWRPGMTDWTPARDVPEIAGHLPPPLPKHLAKAGATVAGAVETGSLPTRAVATDRDLTVASSAHTPQSSSPFRRHCFEIWAVVLAFASAFPAASLKPPPFGSPGTFLRLTRLEIRFALADPLGFVAGELGALLAAIAIAALIAAATSAGAPAVGAVSGHKPNIGILKLATYFLLPIASLPILMIAIPAGSSSLMSALVLILPIFVGLAMQKRWAWVLGFFLVSALSRILLKTQTLGPLGGGLGGIAMWWTLRAWNRLKPLFS